MKRLLSAPLTLLLSIGLLALGAGTAQAAPTDGTRDTTFAPTGVNGTVYASVLDAQGRLVVAGDFTSAEGSSRGRIARYLADGTLDSTFATGTGFNYAVNSLAIDSAGNIIAGGSFTTYDNTAAKGIARLTSTGTRDTTLATGTGFNGIVRSLAIDGTGNIVVGGSFSTYASASASNLARLTPTGTRDTTFTAGFNDSVNTLAIDSTGNILAGGDFTLVGNRRVARIAPNGTLDTAFVSASGTGFSSTINRVAIDAGGNILVGGDFGAYNGVATGPLVRLTPTGARDSTLVTGTGFNGTVNSLALDGNGNIVVGGTFTTYKGTTARRLARLTSTGSLDTTLATGTSFNSVVFSLALDGSGNVLVGGNFTVYNSAAARYIARLTSSVSLGYDLNGGTGGAPATQTTTSGSTVTVAAGTGLTRAGYTFGGWNTAANGSGTARAAGASYTLTASTTLFAQWTAVPTTNPNPNTPNSPTPNSPNPNTPNPSAVTATITLLGGTGSIAAHAPITITATGLTPGSRYTLTMHSTPVVLTTGTTPASGGVQTSATLPAHVPTGTHRLVLDATAADGSPLQVTTTFTVDTNGKITTTGTLAATGNDNAVPLTALGGLLLLAGTGAVLIGRRRQH